jgi:lysine 2,3-aminomutase
VNDTPQTQQIPFSKGRGGQLGRRLRTLGHLIDAGLVKGAERDLIERVVDQFAASITPEAVDLIDRSDPNDPIARQYVPSEEELMFNEQELEDPIGDKAFERTPHLTHRYPDRVLLKPTYICPVYCRFCFRRETVGPESGHMSADDLAASFGYIRAHSEVWEVVLTGGDPLSLSDRRISEMMQELHTIDHVKVVRVHTRYPVVDPLRITPELTFALKGRAAVYVVVHCNHARELTNAAKAACARLIDSGIPMLSQTVLLHGVNDDEVALSELMRTLVQARIKPYYLHHLDLVRGSGHFRTTIDAGQTLVRQLRGRLSGLCQPTYVLDIPSGHGKVPIGPEYLKSSAAPGEYTITDYLGAEHSYVEPMASRVKAP